MTREKVNEVQPIQAPGLDTVDQQLFTQLAEIATTFERDGDAIWGLGFRPDRQPTLLVRSFGPERAYGYALNITDPAALSCGDGSSVQLVLLPAELGLPPVYRFEGDLIAQLGLSKEEPAQFACEVGTDECLAVSYDQDGSHSGSWEFARFFVHEAFHQYQMFEMGWRVPQGYDPSVPWTVDPADSELATREMWYLEAAVTQIAGQGVSDLARSFLEVREKRHARREDLVSLEQGHEQIEGAARYVENIYASLNGRPFRLPVPTVNDVDYHEFASIGRYYRTGARVLELLDRTRVPWRHRLAKGTDPVSILTEFLNAEDGPDFNGIDLTVSLAGSTA